MSARWARWRVVPVVVLLPLAVGCARSDVAPDAAGVADPAPPSSGPGPVVRSAARPVDPDVRVLVVSVDGLNPDAIRQLGRSGAPTLHRLLDQGAGTLNARASVELTVTLPNHTSMMTGRRIDARHGGHGVTFNDDIPGTTVQRAAGHPVASIFTLVTAHGGSTALFTGKEKFGLFERSWPRGIRRYVVDESQQRLVATARRDLVERRRAFTFMHLALPDVTGHATGFMSPSYVDAVARTDRQLGTIVSAIASRPALRDHVVVVLTADHGGRGSGHSDPRRLANYRIPFVAWGHGVTHGDLYRLNPDYRDPGRGRPTYAGRQPVRNADVADLAADLLGLPPVPGSELDRSQDLDVRR